MIDFFVTVVLAVPSCSQIRVAKWVYRCCDCYFSYRSKCYFGSVCCFWTAAVLCAMPFLKVFRCI